MKSFALLYEKHKDGIRKEGIAMAMESHSFGDDGVCELCGFDGTEWDHWKSSIEGFQSDANYPYCRITQF